MRLTRQPRPRTLIARAAVMLAMVLLALGSAVLAGSSPARAAAPLTLSLQLSGDGQTGSSITVHVNQLVTGTAVLSGDGATVASGTITYNLYKSPTCSDTPYDNGPFSVVPGSVPPSSALGLGDVTTYYWQAVFANNLDGATVSSPCGAVVETIVPGALPTTLLYPTLSGDGQSGQAITVGPGKPATESVELNGPNVPTAGGTISYRVYSDIACTQLVYATSPLQAVVNGVVPASPPVTFTTEGKYYWQAVYSGDIANGDSESRCGEEVETVGPPPTVDFSLSGGGQSGKSITVPLSTPVTGQATLSGPTAAGAKGFIKYEVAEGTCGSDYLFWRSYAQQVINGVAPVSPVVSITDLPGPYAWSASFSFDERNWSQPTCAEETVTGARTMTTGKLSAVNTSPATAITVSPGSDVTDQATLSGGNAATATGTITYNVYSDRFCTQLVNPGSGQSVAHGVVPGSAPVKLGPGTYYWQAVYSGDGANGASKSACGEEVETVTAAPPTVALTVSGGGQSGMSITVPLNTPVTGQATLSGDGAATAGGYIEYAVVRGVCSSGSGTFIYQSSRLPVTNGVVPASPVVPITSPGAYYWIAAYSTDGQNWEQTPCANDPVETVTAAPVTIGTSLTGGKAAGVTISVPAGTPVTDAVTSFGGVNAKTASGTLTYTVYSDKSCTVKVADGGTVTVTGGTIPVSAPVTLSAPGTYYWQAAYSGDSANAPGKSGCGNGVETVTAAALPRIDATDSAVGASSATAVLTTPRAGDLIVALVSGKGPAAGHQAATVAGGGLAWHRAARDNARRGDVEIWWARAPGQLANARIRATASARGWTVTLTVIAFRGATGIGAVAQSDSASGAPQGTLVTSGPGSWVLAAGADWAKPVRRAPAAGQVLIHEAQTRDGAFWSQRTGAVVASAGTRVTISDTRPAADPYNLVLAEIRLR
jgi:hypothetical protein